MPRHLHRLLLAPVLVLAACGSGGSSVSAANPPDCPSAKALDEVEVTKKGTDAPELAFDKPLTLKATSCKVIEEGDGDVLKAGATATFDFLFVNARDGKEISSSFDREPAQVPLDDELMKGVRVGLTGLKAGSRILIGITPEDGFGDEGDPASGLEADDALLLYVELLEVRTPLKEASGKAVDPVPGQPTVEVSDEGVPEITVPGGEPPTDLIDQLLIAGDGAVVEAGQTLTVHYTGVLWTTGEEFDSSWARGKPASFPIGTGGVIPGWDKGLVGKKIGSRVLLVIPPADGYAERGSGDTIPPDATLVFVVDILDASDA